jgi:hypothetical protein
MGIYLITYDLKKDKNYDALYEAIKNISGTWCHPAESTWFVFTSLDSVGIRNLLGLVIDNDDVLFVCRMAHGDAAWYNIQEPALGWIHKCLS